MAEKAHSTPAPRRKRTHNPCKAANRPYSPLEAAHAIAQYLTPDPAYWLAEASFAGMSVCPTPREEYLFLSFPQGTDRNISFLRMWLTLSGAEDAVRSLLKLRSQKTEA